MHTIYVRTSIGVYEILYYDLVCYLLCAMMVKARIRVKGRLGVELVSGLLHGEMTQISTTIITFPVRDTSPVMATFCLIGLFRVRDMRADTIVIPALGPSFGTAPSGT